MFRIRILLELQNLLKRIMARKQLHKIKLRLHYSRFKILSTFRCQFLFKPRWNTGKKHLCNPQCKLQMHALYPHSNVHTFCLYQSLSYFQSFNSRLPVFMISYHHSLKIPGKLTVWEEKLKIRNDKEMFQPFARTKLVNNLSPVS